MSQVVEPFVISVNEIYPAPANVQTTTYPRYVGRISPLADIRVTGMSGGPIVAFGSDGAGAWKYWPVAIQSSKNEGNTMVFACPADVFVPLMKAEVQAAKHSQPVLFIPE
jgi:hypothetical protein